LSLFAFTNRACYAIGVFDCINQQEEIIMGKSFADYAELRRKMRPPYGPGLIGDMDTLIAATALHHQFTVVTSDSDFTRVPDLTVLHIPRKTLS
jgi:predicted nucleic acid-binding protein